MTQFSIEIKKIISPEAVVVCLCGYIEQNGGASLKDKIREVIIKKKQPLIINFRNTLGINSYGVAHLMDILEEISYERQIEVHFCCLPKNVSEIFRMIGLSALFPVHLTEEEALAFIRETAFDS